MVGVLGQRDEHLRLVENHFDSAVIHVRGNEITVEGPEAPLVGQVFSAVSYTHLTLPTKRIV